MQETDLEKKLSESGKSVKVKDFKERWEDIKDKLNPAPTAATSDDIVCKGVATAGNVTHYLFTGKKFLMLALCCVLLLAIALSAFLPVVLRKPEIRYTVEKDLIEKPISEEEFYAAAKIMNLDMQRFSFEKQEYKIITDRDKNVKGAAFDFFDEATACTGTIYCYTDLVRLSDWAFGEATTQKIGAMTVRYCEASNADKSVDVKAVIEIENFKYRLNLTIYNEGGFIPFVSAYFK